MLGTPSSPSISRLALAKEMYIIGLHNAQKNASTSRMLAILNFDFSITTIIVACCIDNNQNPKQKNGRAKRWDELIQSFQIFYNKPTADINDLHDLRNSVQHGDQMLRDIGW